MWCVESNRKWRQVSHWTRHEINYDARSWCNGLVLSPSLNNGTNVWFVVGSRWKWQWQWPLHSYCAHNGDEVMIDRTNDGHHSGIHIWVKEKDVIYRDGRYREQCKLKSNNSAITYLPGILVRSQWSVMIVCLLSTLSWLMLRWPTKIRLYPTIGEP